MPKLDGTPPNGFWPLAEHWPITDALPRLSLYKLKFDSVEPSTQDFERWNIPIPRGVAKRKAEFFAGRFCAYQAIQQLTGQGCVPGSAEDRAPQWPKGLVGSISHGHNRAAAIVAEQQYWHGLGLDIEQHLSSERADYLASEILTPQELAQYQLRPAPQRALQLTLSFSLKESLFKALYPLTQRHFYFQDAQCLYQPQRQPIALRLLTDLSEEWPKGRYLQGHYWVFEDYVVTWVAIPPP
ncbi:enterobactin synthetase component D [Azomonas agilis]|uniref:Enterobactin synthase component D n=1 Tax=Azomonas agilis TaxID=116849 RepID=A0A562J201_9GAMM|nr:4'-phosphopantetheinyl transferase superfamily protein [Azomonas agilis]TWH77133.1 enterobactin synthetase component D [Azomonas agilis]